MGIAFPKRVTRDALGPKLIDNYPVENPTSEVGAGTFNGLFSAVAGMALGAPRAILIAKWNGSTFDISAQAETWSPNGDQPHPALNRTGVGVYTYTFASSYLDEEGAAVSTVLAGARCSSEVNHANGRIRGYAWPTALVVDIKLEDSAGTARDAAFYLEVF